MKHLIALQNLNIIEGFFWTALAIAFLFIQKIDLKTRLPLFIFLLAFGISDFLEKEGWWTPLWLLLYKAICLFGILFCFYKIRHKMRGKH